MATERILKFADSKQYLGKIARSGENNTRSLAFDCSSALAEYPASQIIAVIQRPQGDPYTVTPDADGTIRRITLTSYDLEYNGHLQVELRVLDGDKILKSAIYTATVDDSIRGEADAPGQPVRDVLDRLDAEIKQAQAVVDDIRQKLENGELNGKDAEVTAENIQSALGFMPVRDVQAAGESVLSDGVANLPIATNTKLGVVRGEAGIIQVDKYGRLFPMAAMRYDIDERVESNDYAIDINNRSLIPPSQIDYAVKAAMCDGKGAAWTAAEQKVARERMGVDGDYVLLESLTLSEETTYFERSSEPDGTPYDLIALKVIVKFVPGQTSGGFYFYCFNGENRITGGASQIISMPLASGVEWYRSTAIADVKPLFGLYDCMISQGSQGSAMDVTRAENGEYQLSSTDLHITKFNFHVYAANGPTPCIVGTEIQIYGVRA